MIAGLSHDEFWELAPKEAYLSIKAAKAREDAHYSQMAVFVSVLANVAGSGPKQAIKPEQLYEPQLARKKPGQAKKTPKEDAASRRDLKQEIERLAALSPPPQI